MLLQTKGFGDGCWGGSLSRGLREARDSRIKEGSKKGSQAQGTKVGPHWHCSWCHREASTARGSTQRKR